MLKVRCFLLLLLTLMLSSSLFAQDWQLAGENRGEYTYRINSAVLGEQRGLVVRVPPSYARGDARYPVVYMLDGHQPHIRMMEGIIDQQSFSGRMPEMILVSIPNIDRTRDMTPTKTERAGSGGAEKFLQFIEAEVITFVEKNYRTEPYRIFAGHSLAGLAVVNSMVSRPDLFNAYIAASPVLHWDRDYVVKKAADSFKTRKELKKTLFVAVGDEPNYINGINAFRDLLKKSDLRGFEYDFQHWTDEDHGSVVLRAYFGGLRKTFDGWRPTPQQATVDGLVSHYAKLSKRFGYEIKIPENLLNELGYSFLRSDRSIEAIEAFKKNTELYPNSANVYDSLAEAYEKSGSKDKARANYEKAYQMAEKSGEAQLAKSAKANFDRLSSNNK